MEYFVLILWEVLFQDKTSLISGDFLISPLIERQDLRKHPIQLDL